METFKEDLGVSPPHLHHPCCWSFKEGVNPVPSTLQVSADPWDFTVGEQVDAGTFYGPMLPARILWFNPRRQLGTMQLLARSPHPVGWGRE